MSNNGNFIKLPSLRSIEVNNYTLFRKSWSYKVKNGLNLFLGVNELGKTTTANMIIYGLVGLYENITPKYFKSRHQSDADSEPSIALGFKIGDENLFVKRNLFSPQIISFKIGDDEFTSKNTDNLDDAFVTKLNELTGVTSVDDLSFLLRYLLIREEEGNFLLWDQESQSRVIRLLLNYPKFDSEFRKLSEQVRNADSEMRDTQYFVGQLKSDIDRIGDLKNKKLEQIKEYHSINEIQAKLVSLGENINRLRGKKKEALSNITYLTESISKLETENEGLAAQIDYLSDELSALEDGLFESIYTSPKVALASYKLANYNICMFCNNEISKSVAEQIANIIEKRKHCPVCESHIDRTSSKNSHSTRNVKEIEKKHSEIIIMEGKRKHLTEKLNGLENEKDTCWKQYHEIDNSLKEALMNLDELRIKKASLGEGKEDLTIAYDKDIAAFQETIRGHEEKIDKAKRKRQKYENKLKEMNSKLNDLITSFSSQLNSIFDKYASKYFREDCSLAPVVGRKSKDSRTYLMTFVPKFGGQERLTTDSVSTSERIFLESLFRLSLIELYHSYTFHQPFFVLETSEGTFDVHMTRKFAEGLRMFSNNKFPFISITNLSKPQFIKILISGYDNPDNRTLKFLDLCWLSEEQERNKQEFMNIQADIFS